MRNKFLNITATIPNYWNILFDVMSDMAQKVNLSQSSLGSKKHQFNFSPDKIIKIVMIMILIIGAYLLGGRLTNSAPNYQNDRIEAPRAKAKQTLNKTLNIPIKDEKGKEISNIKYVIESVELQDEIIVKGQKAKAVKGRTFFIINIKITNEYKKGIEINTRDYIRLSVNNSKEDLAADIHNDPVGIQAISTKLTRLGFPINDSDKDLTLQIGEINGKKEIVKLNLKKI